MEVNIGEIRVSNNSGPVQIIRDLGLHGNYHRIVRIKFLDTGRITDTRFTHFIDGNVKDKSRDQLLKKYFVSNGCGPIKILEFLGPDNTSRPVVTIQFMNNKSITTAYLDDVENGNVIDPNYRSSMVYSTTCTDRIDFSRDYTSNSYGTFRILGVNPNNKKNCIIRFNLTGTEKEVRIKDALLGAVADNYLNKKIPFDRNLILDYNKWIEKRLYSTWSGIKDRCLREQADRYANYGGAGITMDESWMDFANFYRDAHSIFQFDKYYNDPMSYQIDKDYFQLNVPKNQRIYSKDTCAFLHYTDNENLRAIEYLNEHINELSSKYFGVSKEEGKNYSAVIKVNNVDINLGTYSNEIAAASAFNYWERRYHPYELIPLLNNLGDQEMPPEEFIKYNTRVKQMYSLI